MESRDWSSDVCSSDLLPAPGLAAVKQPSVQQQADQLQKHRRQEQQAAGAKNTGVELNETGFENIARNNDVDTQIGQTLFPRLVNGSAPLQPRPNQHHGKQRALQAKQ